MAIGATIRQLRHEQNITQEQLAEALGITSRAVSQWECGRTAPDISQLPALANFFDVTTDRLLGVDIRRKEDEVQKILRHAMKFSEQGDQEGLAEYLREQLKTYPNEPELLSQLAFALQSLYFRQGRADTEELKREKSGEIIALCERALQYCKPTADSSFPKQLLIFQYLHLNEKEKAREIIASLPDITGTREMYEADVLEGKEALARRQSALLNSFTQMMHALFWKICRDDAYTDEQKIEILKADDALIDLITGGKANVFHGALSVNAVTEAMCFLKLGEEEKALEMLEAAYGHADRFETRPDGEKYAPCWLSELDDKREYTGKTSPDTAYDNVFRIITDPETNFCAAFSGNARFERLMKKLKERTAQ
ncbi:MAG: helix-turn-helix transcriptional regulator [Oscillospiraceae bacterium]|nr:helix-turn-helix transcriptional regulator [Oscillospiraceae bacterium]